MSRHGWVTPLPGGAKARCGGPAICRGCQEERRALGAAPCCYRPKGHDGPHGEPISQTEDADRILYGRCGALSPRGVIRA